MITYVFLLFFVTVKIIVVGGQLRMLGNSEPRTVCPSPVNSGKVCAKVAGSDTTEQTR